ncbi:dimethylamine monooxygenase subunit DmmA family protein [Mycolicibacterium mengxianglii]|uniref:dimethylamine monooxygenase subunit DmmA family protein n=1 Tax=Mycolicibacterium mengxianglii TaxID=2736649 RepID=UPI0018EF33EB|nr:dimethylamine monooxygenase subunit DmmA family protein [Mycolicibacterium mengxianglii]
MPDEGTHPAKTSVPQWPSAPPSLDPCAAEYMLLSLDSDAGDTARRWSAELTTASVPHQVVRIDGPAMPGWIAGCADWFADVASTKVVGWRVAAAGDEVGVLAAAAGARHAGMIDAEITTFAESRRRRMVFCVRCKATTLSTAGLGDRIDCAACQRRLVLRPHVSRAGGTYLGVAEPMHQPV